MSSSSYDATIIMPPMWHIREPWTAPAYICQALRTQGYKVQFLDYNVQLYRMCEELGYGHLWHEGSSFGAWITGTMNYLAHMVDLDEIEGGIIGISVTQTSVSFGVALAARIRERFPNRKLIFGGHPLFFPQEAGMVPTSVAHAVCKGEGDRTICEVMEWDLTALSKFPACMSPTMADGA